MMRLILIVLCSQEGDVLIRIVGSRPPVRGAKYARVRRAFKLCPIYFITFAIISFCPT